MGCAAVGVAGGVSTARAADYSVDPRSAAFLVVTKKEGVASGFAHDHLIAASDFTATLKAPPGEPEKGTFAFVAPVASLSVDAPADQKKWFGPLSALGVQKAAFSEISEGDRAKVKENALDPSQLDAKAHPTVRAEVTGLERKPMSFNGKAFTHSATVRVTVKGKTVEKRLAANVTSSAKEISVESVGPFAFSEFGIEPYSGLFGAVRNADAFHIYVAFTARAKE
jgi:hypothetical protein